MQLAGLLMDLDEAEGRGDHEGGLADPHVDGGVVALLGERRHPSVLYSEEHRVVGAAGQAAHEEVVEVHQRAALASDEQRRADDDHQDVVEPVDELQIGKEEHVINVDREDEGGGPVVDGVAFGERLERVRRDRVQVCEIGEMHDATRRQTTFYLGNQVSSLVSVLTICTL